MSAALFAAGVILPAVALVRQRPEPPPQLLFVSVHCAHCLWAAAHVDSLVVRRATRASIIADSGDWSRIAPHMRVVLDGGRVLARALGIIAVPALVTATIRYDVGR